MADVVWKDVIGFEGLYKVSSDGRILSLQKIRYCSSDVNPVIYPDRVLSPGVVKGYFLVSLSKDTIIFQRKVHRLVAEAFLPKPIHKDQVNHINGIKCDNRVENLEWCTAQENVIHSYKTGLKKGRKFGAHHSAKRVLDKSLGVHYDTVKEAASAEGVAWSTLSSFMNNHHKPMSTKMRQRLSKFIFQT